MAKDNEKLLILLHDLEQYIKNIQPRDNKYPMPKPLPYPDSDAISSLIAYAVVLSIITSLVIT